MDQDVEADDRAEAGRAEVGLKARVRDHGMFVPGALGASAAVLGQVITAVEDFPDRVVWP